MIHHSEVPAYLEENLPDFHREPNDLKRENVYGLIQRFYQYTSEELRQHHYQAARKCFVLAEALYERGNSLVRSAVENSFIYSLTHLFHQHRADHARIMSLMPTTLYSLYVRQFCQPGC